MSSPCAVMLEMVQRSEQRYQSQLSITGVSSQPAEAQQMLHKQLVVCVLEGNNCKRATLETTR